MSADYCHYCNAPVSAAEAQCGGCGQSLVLQGGRYGPDLSFPGALRAEDASYSDSAYAPQITGLLLNESEQDLETVLVSAVAFDAAGAVIGGGYTIPMPSSCRPAAGRRSRSISRPPASRPGSSFTRA